MKYNTIKNIVNWNNKYLDCFTLADRWTDSPESFSVTVDLYYTDYYEYQH